MDSNVQNIAEIYRRVSTLSGTGVGRKLFGHIAQPVFADLQKIEHEKLEREDDDELKDPPSLAQNIKEGLINNFSHGDLLSVVGVVLLGIQSKLFPTKNPNPGFIDKTFRTIALILTFGGSLSAMFGRMLDMHRKVALGDKYADARLKAAEKKGKKIFTEYDEQRIQNLIEESKKLDKVLVYKKGLRELILERYAKDDIGGLLDGPPGTGKTEGVKCILGKWSQRMKAENIKPVIAELNLANFDEYLKETNQNNAEIMEALQITAGMNPGSNASIANGEGLLILELLVKKIQKLINNTNRHNDQNPNQQERLAIFVDEFDKIFDPKTLQGCDKLRLKNLLVQFNDLFVKANILLTSNTSLEDMIKEIKKHLKSQDGSDAEEVWKPMYNRFASKNRAKVDLPGAQEQAEIVAARLLRNYKDLLDWNDFGLHAGQLDNTELSRTILAKPIFELINKLKLNLDGRQLSYACDDITSMLLGRARELRLQQSIPDSKWDSLSPEEKIQSTKSLIDRDILEAVLINKALGDRMNRADKDRETLKLILSSYFSNREIQEALKTRDIKAGISRRQLLQVLPNLYETKELESGSVVYFSKEEANLDGKSRQHVLVRNNSDLADSVEIDPSFSVEIFNKDQYKDRTKLRDFKLSELTDLINEVLEERPENKKSKILSSAFDTIKHLIKAEKTKNPEELLDHLHQSLTDLAA